MGQRCLPVAVVGHLCVDLAPRLREAAVLEPGRLFDVGPLGVSLGGCVANTGSRLLELGVDAHLAATVGDDDLAEVVRAAALRSFGERVTLDVEPGAGTSYSVVVEPPGQDRTFWHHSGANDAFTGGTLPPGDVVHVGYPSLLPGLLAKDGTPLLDLLRRASARGSTTSLDLAVVDEKSAAGQRDWADLFARVLPLVDVLSPSLDDLLSALRIDPGTTPRLDLADELAGRLLGWGAAVAVVSAGAEGLVVRTAGRERLERAGSALAPRAEAWAGRRFRRPVIAPRRIVSTNGAGDAATAGLLAAVAAGADPETAALVAVTVAATVIAGDRVTPTLLEDLVTPAPTTPSAPGDPAAGAAPSAPLLLPANQPRGRFYRGGAAIGAFRGTGAAEEFTPEDWVGSVTCVRGEPGIGETSLPDGVRLRDAVAADPEGWLGAAHVAAFGADTKLLVKLLDAGQRLPVHAHPHDDFAQTHCGTAHGKAEAWYILSPGEVWLGLARDLDAETLGRLVTEQDIDTLLGAMHRIPVAAGDRVYVPPGVLHAIGQGILLAEVQEPEDLSILLEWRDFELDGATDGHLDLGFPLALSAVEHSARSREQVEALLTRADDPGPGLPVAAEEYFRLDRHDVRGSAELEAGFAILVVTEGPLEIGGVPAPAGSTLLVAAAAGGLTVRGNGELLACRPPVAR
ncbi:PfkB family carbohydrate kinase [Kineococcus gynurae]